MRRFQVSDWLWGLKLKIPPVVSAIVDHTQAPQPVRSRLAASALGALQSRISELAETLGAVPLACGTRAETSSAITNALSYEVRMQWPGDRTISISFSPFDLFVFTVNLMELHIATSQSKQKNEFFP